MPVHQPFYLGFAAFGLLPFLIMVGASVYSYRSRKPSEHRFWWMALLYLPAYALLDLHWYSKAYDRPYQASPLTMTLEWAAAVMLWVALGVAWGIRRRHGKTASG